MLAEPGVIAASEALDGAVDVGVGSSKVGFRCGPGSLSESGFDQGLFPLEVSSLSQGGRHRSNLVILWFESLFACWNDRCGVVVVVALLGG